MIELLLAVCSLLPLAQASIEVHPSPRLWLPETRQVGIASSQGDLVESCWEDITASVFRMEPELVWLGRWGSPAKEKAAELGIDHVILVRRAAAQGRKPITYEYGKKQGVSGMTARVRFEGAYSEIELDLLSSGEDWGAVGRWRGEVEARPPFEIHSGDAKQELKIDPQRQFADLARQAFAGGVKFLAARALWSVRGEIAARADSLRICP